MSSDDDDYMSDKFLAKAVPEAEDIRPSLVKLKRDQRQLEIYKKKIKLTEPKRAVKEAVQREKGLETAISSENKGFQMLAKMGYKPGTSLGKSNEGIIEPINVIVKKDTKGVGVTKKPVKRDNKVFERLEGDFRQSVKEKASQRDFIGIFRKAQKSCEHFDSINDIKMPSKIYYWPKEIIDTLIEKNKAKSEEEKEEEEEEEKEEEEHFDEFEYEEEHYDQFYTNDNLENLIEYLRTKYFYCIFCASVGSDENDLKSFCPGPLQQDHDE